jgi:arabinofuranosyltransferase
MITASSLNRALGPRAWWVSAGLCAGLSAAIWGYTVDDAYIVFRYARNLVEGNGAVFNIGERVEGFSSPLWLAVATIAEGLHLPVEQVCKALSLAAVIVMLWYVARCMRSLSLAARLPLLLLAACAPLPVAVVCGLETAVNAVIVLFLLLTAYKGEPRRVDVELGGDAAAGTGLSSAALAFWGCLALLCRPENGLLVGVHGLYLWCARPDQRRRLYMAATIWFAVGALLTLARFAYYGAVLPNTAVAKVSMDAAFGGGGQGYCVSWLRQYWWLVLLGVSAFAARPARRMVLNAWLLIAAQVAFVFFVGGDWMPQWRFLLPATVLLAVLGCYGLDAMLTPASRAVRTVPASACVVGAMVLLATQCWYFRGVRWTLDYYQRQLDLLAAGPVQYIAERAGRDDVVVARDIGVLGYRSRCRILDVVGLTDRHVARSSGYRHRDRIDNDYVFTRNPAYLMLQTGNDRDADPIPLDNIARTLMRDERFSQYHLRKHWVLPGRHYCEVYARTQGNALRVD